MTKPRALLVAPEAPFPMHGGGALRTAALLHYLAGRYTVDALFFRSADQPDPRDFLPPGLISDSTLITLPPHSKAFLPRALRNLRRAAAAIPPLVERFSGEQIAIAQWLTGRGYALAVVEHFWCAPYASILRPHCERLILDLHNIESAWHHTLAAAGNIVESAVHRRFASAARRWERRWLPAFDTALATSETDAARVRLLAPNLPVVVYPNTVPDRAPSEAPRGRRIIFAGNLAYQPNRDGIAWFARRVWPELRAAVPDLHWAVVGKNPEGIPALLPDDPRITLIGPVEDAVAEIARSVAMVVPLHAGSGTRLKILEAWITATPVISTVLGAEGLPASDGENLRIARDPAAFAQATAEIVSTPALAARIGAAGRAAALQEFTWEAGWKRLAGAGV